MSLRTENLEHTVEFLVLVALCFPPVSSRPLINDWIVGSLSGCGQGVRGLSHEAWAAGHKASCPGQPPPDQIMVTEPGAAEGKGYRLTCALRHLLKGRCPHTTAVWEPDCGSIGQDPSSKTCGPIDSSPTTQHRASGMSFLLSASAFSSVKWIS